MSETSETPTRAHLRALAHLSAMADQHGVTLAALKAEAAKQQRDLDALEASVRAWAIERATLRQLVAEAYSLLNDPESRVDLRDWLRAAAPYVEGGTR